MRRTKHLEKKKLKKVLTNTTRCDKVFIADERESNFLKASQSTENKGFSVGTLIIEQ